MDVLGPGSSAGAPAVLRLRLSVLALAAQHRSLFQANLILPNVEALLSPSTA